MHSIWPWILVSLQQIFIKKQRSIGIHLPEQQKWDWINGMSVYKIRPILQNVEVNTVPNELWSQNTYKHLRRCTAFDCKIVCRLYKEACSRFCKKPSTVIFIYTILLSCDLKIRYSVLSSINFPYIDDRRHFISGTTIFLPAMDSNFINIWHASDETIYISVQKFIDIIFWISGWILLLRVIKRIQHNTEFLMSDLWVPPENRDQSLEWMLLGWIKYLLAFIFRERLYSALF